MNKENYNITAVIPAYSSISIVNNSVISLCTQWIPDDTFQLEIIIVNDNPEKSDQYNWYLTEEFKKVIKPNIEIRIITHLKNSGQGVARNTGINNAKNNWIVLCDEDDMYAPNAIYRFWEILKKENKSGEDNKEISIICAPIYSFDKDFYSNIIDPWSIWVNSKLYNRRFLNKYNIQFPTDENSHRAEDYPFSRMVDYASRHDESFKRIDFSKDIETVYYWYPNYTSRSRKDKHYGSLLAGYTMRSSNRIFDFISNFNKKHINKEEDFWKEDENLKHEILNMNIYAFYNLLSFIKELSDGWDDCQEEYWNILRDSVSELRNKLLIYWDEIVPSDIADMQYQVKHNSDCRITESWIGSFEAFINNKSAILDYSYNQVLEYAKNLKFDGANHEINAPYVKAWERRRKTLKK